ncbi:hypothetical protein POM88_037474 [Heracleum sosnowskyi]|uniref:Uncharacterized protein n=1 Tax=Heracleum sosnowskyi TaxID=360622 RepID=A0AAD8HS26_9APIA|nr:hypothetical protein POM88_037474 [Heracleum sosnowskyi]
MFVVVTAAIIASQALISGDFAIISQSLSLGCFPKVKVVQTSAKDRCGRCYVHLHVSRQSNYAYHMNQDKIEEVIGRTRSSTIHEESLSQLKNSLRISSTSKIINGLILGVGEEMQFVQNAKNKCVVYLLGEADVVDKEDSSWFKKMIVNNAYSFITKNFRQGEKTLEISQTRLLRVGMMYEI